MIEQRGYGIGQGRGVAERHQKPAVTIGDDLGNTPCPGADDRPAVQPGFQQDDAEAVILAGQGKERTGRQQIVFSASDRRKLNT